MLGDQLEQRVQRFPRRFEIFRCPAFLCRCIKRREIELLIRRVEGGKQIENFFLNFVGALIGTIRLVDDDDRFESER